ncbi:MAG TPA: LD-carboxypeptidase, partial [Thermoanaerobaculia bacterium]|jgi:muramoyltetrapeptide carboxypeptidase
LILPPALRPGATIGVAAVSGPVEEPALEAGLSHLEKGGYRVREASNLRAREGFLAGDDAARAQGYRELLRDPSVDAIVFARGGYGAARILAHLDVEEARRHPKIHLGGSDLTALFAWLARAGLTAFYGPMVAVEMARGDAGDWERILSGDTPAPHRFASEDILSTGLAEGPLVGGCLSLLASLCGTPDALTTGGAVLFLEDIHEEPYRLDRLLTQLERSGTLDGIKGMIIGSLLPPPGRDLEAATDAWLAGRLAGARFPVARRFPAGHLSSPRTLPLGTTVRLDLTGADPTLNFSGPGVAA